MYDFFMRNPEYALPMVAIGCGALIAIIAIVACQWRAVRQLETEGALKQDMLNRGMSVEQIERVLRASSAAAPQPDKPETITDNEYYALEKLVDEGKSAEEIERIMRAFRGPAEPGAAKLPEKVSA
jgi:hypothetical protein